MSDPLNPTEPHNVSGDRDPQPAGALSGDLVGHTLGQYRILEQIGEGGMATVYKSFQPGLNRTVALKVLPPHYARQPGFSARFGREAEAIANLHHPNILPVYDSGQEGGYSYLVMRYVEGARTLREEMAEPMELGRMAALIGQVAAALDCAHEQGVIHRDVKPGNVLMDGEWALLTDFGLAKITEASVKLTGTGVGFGTPAYMSPEQGQGKEVDGRSDVYSLGIIVYEMLTGQIPHRAETPMATVVKRLTEPLPLPRALNPGIPEAVEQVVLKALARDREDRYGSAGEMAEALEQAVRESGVAGAELPRRRRVPAGARRGSGDAGVLARVLAGRRWLAVAGAALIVLGLLAWGLNSGFVSIGRRTALPLEMTRIRRNTASPDGPTSTSAIVALATRTRKATPTQESIPTSTVWPTSTRRLTSTVPVPSSTPTATTSPPDLPSAPVPMDGAMNQSLDVKLSWSGNPDGRVLYDVSLRAGQDMPYVLVCNDTPDPVCDPGELRPGTHYSWRVTAAEPSGAIRAGPEWRFFTVQACRVRLNDDPTEYQSVQAAVDASTRATDVVKVAGYCPGVEPRAGFAQTVYLDKTLTLQGGWNGSFAERNADEYPATLDAEGQGRVIYITGDVQPTVEGLHITGGVAPLPDGDGGGVFVDLAAPTLANNTVFSNTASYREDGGSGGGLYLNQSAATLTGNTVISNTARWGGGLALSSSPATLRSNIVRGNSAFLGGGGLGLSGSGAVLDGNTITANSATYSGGGLYVSDGAAWLVRNTIAANRASGGAGAMFWRSDATLDANLVRDHRTAAGALFMHASGVRMTNNLIVDNAGEALRLEGAWPHLSHNTFARNGTGLSVADRWEEGTYYSSTVVLTNTIMVAHNLGIRIEGNNAVTVDGILWHDTPYTTTRGVTSGLVVQHQRTGDPAFVDPDAGDYHIRAGSAAVDAGVDTGLEADIDGHARPQGAGPDLGADEFMPAADGANPSHGKIVVECQDDGPPQICILDTAFNLVQQVTRDLGFEEIGDCAWSPDGEQIVFDAGAEAGSVDTDDHGLYVIGRDGSSLIQVTGGLPNDRHPAWSSDRQWIAFHRDCGLWVVRPDGSQAQALVGAQDPFCALRSAWSPDSERVAFLSPLEATRPDEVWVVNVDGSGAQVIHTLRSTQHASQVAWSPDGQQIACWFWEGDREQVLLIDVRTGGTSAVIEARDQMPWSWLPSFWPPWAQ